MKKIALLLFASLSFIACDNDDDTQEPQQSSLTINFTQSFDQEPVNSASFNNTVYTNANGEALTIDRLRYLMTDIFLTNEAGVATTMSDYNFIDVSDNTGAILTTDATVAEGSYTLSMRFGFEDSKNITGAYPDLNAAVFNVPEPPNVNLGGGYHYMQLEGKYTNTASEVIPFQYHAIRAVQGAMDDTQTFQDTSIPLNLGTVNVSGENTEVLVDMNVAEWFKNPNQWNLNELYRILMPNFNAQIMINENGQNAFSMVQAID